MNKWIPVWLAACIACGAAPEAVERQAAVIRRVLQAADDAYHNRGEPLMGDAAYDALREQYARLAAQHPDLPGYAQVGASLPDSAAPVPHAHPVLSLQKAYADTDVETFLAGCGRDQSYAIEPKLDGLTVVLRYRDGLLEQALTRGDGSYGQEITAAILAAGCAPPVLQKNGNGILEVRGEVVLSFDAFEALNARRRAEGLEPLKSPRNSAAGTLQLIDRAEIARRGLQLRIFEVVAAEPPPATQAEALARAAAAGLPVVESRVVPAVDVLATIEEVNRIRAGGPFPTDGVVIKLNDRAAYARLGATTHHPRGALARKYRETPVETVLLRVEWNRGESGRITPVAFFEPVAVDGATLQSASLHNADHLRALDLMVGDRIQVVRAGGAVPEILGRAPGPRTGAEQPIAFP